MPEQKVLVREEGSKKRPKVLPPDTEAAWKWVGWIGLLLMVVGLSDFLLAWYPTKFGSPEWEFATVAQTFSGLPLVSIGVAGLLGSALALGRRWLLWAVIGLLSAGVLVLLAIRLGSNPQALQGTRGLMVGNVERYDERDIVFARNRALRPDSQ